ncbi:MAG TPA: hypothetical protein VF525_20115 [Pyrinomonadaceae bacterium]|jgi:hypothetical protein
MMEEFADVAAAAPLAPARVAQGVRGVRLSARRLLGFVLLAAIGTMTVEPITDPDFWWHLRTGELILQTRAIPHVDLFSYTAAGWEWVTHEWLTEVLMATAYRCAGWGGLIVLFSLVMTGAFCIVYRRCMARAPHPFVAGLVVLVGALATAPTWGVRPQMISFLLTSVYLAALDDYVRRARSRALWWLAPLMLLWANMHGGFALGLVLLALGGVGVVLDELAQGSPPRRIWARVRPLCLVLAACVLVVPLNPNGVRLFTYPLETLNSHAMHAYIDEWRSPDFHLLIAQPFALLLIATFVLLALSPQRPRLSELLLLCVSTYAALRAWRNMPFCALVAMPIMAEHAWAFATSRSWGRWLTAPEQRAAGTQPAWQVALNVALLVCVPVGLYATNVRRVVARQPAIEAEKYPAAAVAYLRAHPTNGRIFNGYGWGGYLIWQLYPQQRVFIDGRADVYGDRFIEAYLQAEGGEPEWRAPLERYDVRTVMLNPRAPLASLLKQEPGWTKVYEDKQAIIFSKQ